MKAAVEEALGRIRFEPWMARAAKGQWTGPSACRDDGTQTVSDSFKMPNGWSFGDYDVVRKLLADAVVDLTF